MKVVKIFTIFLIVRETSSLQVLYYEICYYGGELVSNLLHLFIYKGYCYIFRP